MRRVKMKKYVPYQINYNVGSLLSKDEEYLCIGEFKNEETGKDMVAVTQNIKFMPVVTEKENVEFLN